MAVSVVTMMATVMTTAMIMAMLTKGMRTMGWNRDTNNKGGAKRDDLHKNPRHLWLLQWTSHFLGEGYFDRV